MRLAAEAVQKWTALAWVRGTVLVSLYRHTQDLVDNWVVGRYMAGQIALFPQRNHYILANAATAMRTLLQQSLMDFGYLNEKAFMVRAAKIADGLVRRVCGRRMDEQKVKRYAREISRWGITGWGRFAQMAGGGKGGYRYPPFREWGKVMQGNRAVNKALEDIPRVATYITARESNYSPRAAADLVNRSFPSYGREIKQPLDDFMRDISMFYPYTRSRTEQVLANIYHYPGRAVVGTHALGSIAEAVARHTGMEHWEQFLTRHGRQSYMGDEFIAVKVPRDDKGEVLAAEPWATLFRSLEPSDAMVQYGGEHYLFINTSLSPWQMTGNLKGFFSRQPGQPIYDILNPPMKAVVDIIAGERPGTVARRFIEPYIPFGRPIMQALSGAGRPQGVGVTPQPVLRRQADLDKAALARKRFWLTKLGGLSVQILSTRDLLENLSYKDWQRLAELREARGLAKPPLIGRALREARQPIARKRWEAVDEWLKRRRREAR